MKHNALVQAILAGIASIPPALRVFAAADGADDLPVIKPLMVLRVSAAAAKEYELIIYGDIGESWWGESVTAQSIVQQLAALDPAVTQINVRINSYGGSVSDGMAIYNVLKRTAAKKIGTVDGVAMSSASLVAMACDELSMPESSILMIHAPWGLAQGNASDMRIMADVLDTYAEAMVGAYTAKSKQPKADMLALLKDGQDHYYTGEQAVAAGFADKVITAVADPAEADAAESNRPRGLNRFLSHAPAAIAAMAIAAARRSPITATGVAVNPASSASTEDSDMLRKTKRGLVSLPPKARSTTVDNALPAGGGGGEGGDTTLNPADIRSRAMAELGERNRLIEAALKPVMHIGGIPELHVQALGDLAMTLDQVHARALALAGAKATPTAGNGGVEAGADQRDKDIEAMSQIIVARGLSAAKGPDGKRLPVTDVDPANPFRTMSLSAMAEHCVRASGHNTSRMSRSEIASLALQRPVAAAGHTTSDFPTLLGNTINRILLVTYTSANTRWMQFCKISDLADFRPNTRLRMGSFDDIKVVNEAGNYEQGTFGDATAETIKALRKGRKLVISREMIVNDDLQAFADIAAMLGGAAARTVEKDVFALFALNSGAGPVMGDGFNLFDATHHLNVAATPAAPSVISFDAARQQLAVQTDNSGNDYLDILPSIWLGPSSLYGAAQLLNINATDPSVTNKFLIRNIVEAMFDKVIGTPRLTGTPWYVLADPNVEPVFEVGFVDGQRTPRTDSQVDFDSDGVKWKVVLEYGVAATGWRGIVKNAGA